MLFLRQEEMLNTAPIVMYFMTFICLWKRTFVDEIYRIMFSELLYLKFEGHDRDSMKTLDTLTEVSTCCP